MASKEEPKCTHISVQASVGGKVTIVKFDLSSNYGFSQSRDYTIPEGWTEEEINAFRETKQLELYEQIDSLAQPVLEDLMDQSMVFQNGRHTG